MSPTDELTKSLLKEEFNHICKFVESLQTSLMLRCNVNFSTERVKMVPIHLYCKKVHVQADINVISQQLFQTVPSPDLNYTKFHTTLVVKTCVQTQYVPRLNSVSAGLQLRHGN